MPTEQGVRACLREIVDPCSVGTGLPLNILEMGLLRDIEITSGHVAVRLRLTTPMCMLVPYFLDQVQTRVGALPDVESVTCEADAGLDWDPAMMSEGARLASEAPSRGLGSEDRIRPGSAPASTPIG